MFNSQFADKMTLYLELRKNLVAESSYLQDKRVLLSLDRFIIEKDFSDEMLTESILTQWMNSLTGKSTTMREKVGVIRSFVKYLNSLGDISFLPPAPRVKSDYIPYIYSDKEIEKIFYYADNLPIKFQLKCMPFIKLKIPMILRILYGCGTRLGETISIQRKDIDFINGTILLHHTKFSKERIIPIHDSLLVILKDYCCSLGILNSPDALLFEGKIKDKPITKRQVEHWFSIIIQYAGINQPHKEFGKRGACIHCLRHLFVIKSVMQLESSGHSVDMNDLLLPTYLGHKCLVDTDKYMKYTGAQSQKDVKVFESFTKGLIPNVEVPYEEE